MSFDVAAQNQLSKAQVLREGLNERERAMFDVKVAQVYATLHVGNEIAQLREAVTPDQITMVQNENGATAQDNDESQ